MYFRQKAGVGQLQKFVQNPFDEKKRIIPKQDRITFVIITSPV